MNHSLENEQTMDFSRHQRQERISLQQSAGSSTAMSSLVLPPSNGLHIHAHTHVELAGNLKPLYIILYWATASTA